MVGRSMLVLAALLLYSVSLGFTGEWTSLPQLGAPPFTEDGGLGDFTPSDSPALRDTWADGSPSESPSARSTGSMAYASQSDRVIIFGGSAPAGQGSSILLNETWAYDFNSNTWTNMSPTISPRGFHDPIVYDSESDRVILFGGILRWKSGGVPRTYFSNEIWAYDFNSNTWTNLTPSESPTGRYGHALAYDSESDRTILFGGFTEVGGRNDETWSYDLNSNSWTEMNPTSIPPPRDTHAMAYDAESDRVILLGGDVGGIVLSNRTWAYDFNADKWTEMNPATSPPARWTHTMAYDAESDRILLFGGKNSPDGPPNSETWSYDFNANMWANMNAGRSPSIWGVRRMAYDSESDRTVLFGSTSFPQPYGNETWAYDLNVNEWAPLTSVAGNLTIEVGPLISTFIAGRPAIFEFDVLHDGVPTDDVTVRWLLRILDPDQDIAEGSAIGLGAGRFRIEITAQQTNNLLIGTFELLITATGASGTTAIERIPFTIVPGPDWYIAQFEEFMRGVNYRIGLIAGEVDQVQSDAANATKSLAGLGSLVSIAVVLASASLVVSGATLVLLVLTLRSIRPKTRTRRDS